MLTAAVGACCLVQRRPLHNVAARAAGAAVVRPAAARPDLVRSDSARRHPIAAARRGAAALDARRAVVVPVRPSVSACSAADAVVRPAARVVDRRAAAGVGVAEVVAPSVDAAVRRPVAPLAACRAEAVAADRAAALPAAARFAAVLSVAVHSVAVHAAGRRVVWLVVRRTVRSAAHLVARRVDQPVAARAAAAAGQAVSERPPPVETAAAPLSRPIPPSRPVRSTDPAIRRRGRLAIQFQASPRPPFPSGNRPPTTRARAFERRPPETSNTAAATDLTQNAEPSELPVPRPSQRLFRQSVSAGFHTHVLTAQSGCLPGESVAARHCASPAANGGPTGPQGVTYFATAIAWLRMTPRPLPEI